MILPNLELSSSIKILFIFDKPSISLLLKLSLLSLDSVGYWNELKSKWVSPKKVLRLDSLKIEHVVVVFVI